MTEHDMPTPQSSPASPQDRDTPTRRSYRLNRRHLVLALLLALAATIALVLLVLLFRAGQKATGLLDPDSAARGLALRDARAGATLNYEQQWQDYSPCFQSRNPEQRWIASKSAEARNLGAMVAPANTNYTVVTVHRDGIYRRVEVRVQTPTGRQLDYEIDVRMYANRWVKVDDGDLGHTPIQDYCTLPSAS